MNLAHLLGDIPLRQTVIICSKILRPEQPITRHTTLQTNKKKKNKETSASHFYRLSQRKGTHVHVPTSAAERGEACGRLKWNNPPLMSSRIGTFLPFHTASPLLFGRPRKGNLVLLQALWRREALWYALGSEPIDASDWWLNSPTPLDVNVMRILDL